MKLWEDSDKDTLRVKDWNMSQNNFLPPHWTQWRLQVVLPPGVFTVSLQPVSYNEFIHSSKHIKTRQIQTKHICEYYNYKNDTSNHLHRNQPQHRGLFIQTNIHMFNATFEVQSRKETEGFMFSTSEINTMYFAVRSVYKNKPMLLLLCLPHCCVLQGAEASRRPASQWAQVQDPWIHRGPEREVGLLQLFLKLLPRFVRPPRTVKGLSRSWAEGEEELSTYCSLQDVMQSLIHCWEPPVDEWRSGGGAAQLQAQNKKKLCLCKWRNCIVMTILNTLFKKLFSKYKEWVENVKFLMKLPESRCSVTLWWGLHLNFWTEPHNILASKHFCTEIN